MPLIRPRLYSVGLIGGYASFNPVDATLYFWGGHDGIWATASGKEGRVYFPKKGVIRAVNLTTYNGAVAGTNEDMTMYIRLNNTTDYLIGTVGSTDRIKTWLNESLNIPVTPTDYIEIKITTPTWVTNPTGVSSWGCLLIECP